MKSTKPPPSVPRPIDVARELCRRDVEHFITSCCQIKDDQNWFPFTLWPTQLPVLRCFTMQKEVIVLKARQLGLSWLALAYALWLMLFRPGCTILLFSKRDDEAKDLLKRLRLMHDKLPNWMRLDYSANDAHIWQLVNGSIARAFPTTAGQSYTATLVILDEADYMRSLGDLLVNVKPTIDAGGQIFLISTSDKASPQSAFKAIYRAAKKGENSYAPVFLPWNARPERTEDWHAQQKKTILANTGALDDLHESYPASDVEALAPRSLDKRIPYDWINRNYVEMAPITTEHLDRRYPGWPAIPGLEIYRAPEAGKKYVIGADTAEGNPTSDDSAFEILEEVSGEEVACLGGKFEPAILAHHIDVVGTWYNAAAVLVERNNHGHAAILWLSLHSKLRRLFGDDGKVGWISTERGKVVMYDAATDAFRNDDVILHSFATLTQLSSIEGATQRAPTGEHDDRADSLALAVLARVKALKESAANTAKPFVCGTPRRM
jgi:hypothetical protein